jgi:hypothetical protein
MKRIEIGLLLLALTALAGCNITINGGNSGIKGSGVAASEDRQIEEFETIAIVGYGNVDLTIGPETSLTLTTDDNLIELVDTVVENGQLTIRPKESINAVSGLKFVITTPNLTKVKVVGATTLKLTDASGEELDIDVSGAGKVSGSGAVTDLKVSVAGAGSINLSKLKAENTKVSISGAGSASVYASESVAATVAGAASVSVYGNPPTVKKSVSGVGRVKLVD